MTFVVVLSCAAIVAYVAMLRDRAKRDQCPEPQVPRYAYTTDRSYDQTKAIASARAARHHSPSGRPFRGPRMVTTAAASC
jgi:hypothetical protein